MENELRTKARQMSPDGQYQLRRSIVRLLKEGMHYKKIAKTLDVSEVMVFTTKKAYKESGLAGIKPKKRGRKEGEKRVLSPKQEKEIQKIIIDKTPEQLKLPCCMWTLKAIRDLIAQIYKINMKDSTLGYYLSRWGFSIQRPIKKALKQDPVKVEKWLKEEYPAIAAKAKEEKAEIFWGDETALQNTSNYARGYAPEGQTPVLEIESKKLKLNLLSAISNRGKLRFTISKESINSDILIEFLKRLIRDSKSKVFLILDNLRVHHSKKVKAWVEGHRAKIELFFLPPYSPEHNPDEYLNSDLKQDTGKKPIPRNEKELAKNARSFLKRIQLKPAHICSYFRHKMALYAA